MVRKLIAWTTLDNPLVVHRSCTRCAWPSAVVGSYSFVYVNVEAYPDPAPAIIEVFAQFPGASAEEVERQVTVPARSHFRGHARPQVRSAASRSTGLSRLEDELELRQPIHVRSRPAGSHQSPGHDSRSRCPPGSRRRSRPSRPRAKSIATC